MHQDFLGEQQTESATSPVAWRAADRVCDQPGCMASSRQSLRPARLHGEQQTESATSSKSAYNAAKITIMG